MTATATGPVALTGRVVRPGDADYADAKYDPNDVFSFEQSIPPANGNE
jgi:hypothetical protein